METVACVQWVREHNLYGEAEKIATALKQIYINCLAAKNEKILIVGDTGASGRYVSAVLSAGYYLAAEQLHLDAKLIFQDARRRGTEADPVVVAALAALGKGGIIILTMSDKLGGISELGKSFRKWAKKMEHRFVSAMSLGDLPTEKIELIRQAMDISYKPLQAQHMELKKKLDAAKEIRVTTPAGTDFIYNVEDVPAILADGNYTQGGTGGNVPAGEIYLPPHGKKVNGTIVIDGSCRTREHTLIVKEPITLKVVDGTITEITGGIEAQELQATLDWAASVSKNPGGIRRICEFGIGLNPKAQIIGAMIVDDKTLGTAHIGIGSNYWFGGTIYAIIHLDQVFRNPTIYVDGEILKV